MGFLFGPGGLFGPGVAPSNATQVLGQQPISPDQLAQNQAGVGSSLAQQQAFLNALSAQGGIGNQANVFAQQQALANQLGEQAMGGGPNPALAQLAQTTGQNVQNQASLLAGQRGVSANPGLAAQQIGQAGSQAQQQAVGQAATLRAQQQLEAQQALQQQQAIMGGLATQQIGQQQGALQQLTAGNLQNMGMGLQANANYQNLLGGLQGATAKANSGVLGGLIGGVGSVLAGGNKPQAGGAESDYAGGVAGEGSIVAKFLEGAKPMVQGGRVPGKAKVKGDSYQNDTVPAMLSPKEVVLPRSITLAEDAPEQAAKFVAALKRKGKLS